MKPTTLETILNIFLPPVALKPLMKEIKKEINKETDVAGTNKEYYKNANIDVDVILKSMFKVFTPSFISKPIEEKYDEAETSEPNSENLLSESTFNMFENIAAILAVYICFMTNLFEPSETTMFKIVHLAIAYTFGWRYILFVTLGSQNGRTIISNLYKKPFTPIQYKSTIVEY